MQTTLELEFQAELNQREFPQKVCYRPDEKERIVASLLAGQSLFVLGEAGSGKTAVLEFVADELKAQGFPVVRINPSTAKQIMTELAQGFGLDTESLEGKALTTLQLQQSVEEFLTGNIGFVIVDNLPRVSISVRLWLEKLYDRGQPILAAGKSKPEKDLIFKLVALELGAMPPLFIRQIMLETANKLELEISQHEYARLQQRTGGNPAIAQKVMREFFLGLPQARPAGHQNYRGWGKWIILPFLLLSLFRYAGREPVQMVGAAGMSTFVITRILFTPSKRRLGGHY
jgi:hypothetical protein